MVYQLNDLVIDSGNFQILNFGKQVAVEPKVFDLIIYLIKNRNRLISRDELFDQVWKGAVVSDTSLSNRIKSARKILGDDAKQQKIIKTIHARGYQFVASISKIQQPDRKTVQHLKQQAEGPLLAIFPLQNLSSDSEQDYLAEGISEDLTTELSRFKNIQVVSRHSAFQIDQNQFDIQQIRQQFHIDYFIEGSVRRLNENVRINIQLIDTYSGHHVWAEKFDDVFENIYLIQDKIVEQVVSIIASEVIRVETGRSLSRSTKDLRAYDYFLRGLYFYKTSNADCQNYSKSMNEFKKAMDLDPLFTRARVWFCCARFSTWDKLTEDRLHQQIEDVKAALSIDSGESECHRLLGMLYFHRKNYENAEYHHQQALSLSPNDAYINIKAGMFLSLMDRGEEGVQLCNRAIYLNPLHPSWFWRDLAIAYYSIDQFEQAIESLNKHMYKDEFDICFLAACYSALGDELKATELIDSIEQEQSKVGFDVFLKRISFKDETKNELLKQRMKAAGLKS